jgi:hypothetical protein
MHGIVSRSHLERTQPQHQRQPLRSCCTHTLHTLSRHGGVGCTGDTTSSANPPCAETGLLYFGSAPVLQSHTSTRYCRGTGFLVPSAHSASFTYLGTRSPLMAGYGAVWARWHGPSQTRPLYLASVYCPDTGAQRRNVHLLLEVYEQVSAGLTYYFSKPGTVCLMGD